MNWIRYSFLAGIIFILSCFGSASVFAQISISAVGGIAYNMPLYEVKSGNNTSPDLYGNAVGGYIGTRLYYEITPRFGASVELAYQVLPYTIKYVTGQLYPGYGTISVAPYFAVHPKLQVEAGLGTGLTVVSRFANQQDNDPLFFSTLGLRIPLGRWEISMRYYRFLRPLYLEETDRNSTTFGSHGVQIGTAYTFFRQASN